MRSGTINHDHIREVQETKKELAAANKRHWWQSWKK
ncbi:DUF3967 domain-containing protein [Mangrovibacillus sp. Mu-81]